MNEFWPGLMGFGLVIAWYARKIIKTRMLYGLSSSKTLEPGHMHVRVTFDIDKLIPIDDVELRILGLIGDRSICKDCGYVVEEGSFLGSGSMGILKDLLAIEETSRLISNQAQFLLESKQITMSEFISQGIRTSEATTEMVKNVYRVKR